MGARTHLDLMAMPSLKKSACRNARIFAVQPMNNVHSQLSHEYDMYEFWICYKKTAYEDFTAKMKLTRYDTARSY